MKKFLCFIFLSIISFSSAQISWGVKTGLNLSKIRDEKIDYKFSVTGIYAGGFAQLKLNDQLFFQPEILFSMQGGKSGKLPLISINEIGAEVIEGYLEFDEKLYYINLPLMIKYQVLEKLNFEVGPQVGFVLKSELTTKSDKFGTEKRDMDCNVDLGVNVGLEYTIYKSLGIGIRYSKGITNIHQNSDSINKNSLFSTGLSYRF